MQRTDWDEDFGSVDEARPDGRPRDVVLALKILAGSVGFSLFSVVIGILDGGGLDSGIFGRAVIADLIISIVSSAFIFLIWMGTGWAKNIFLFVVALNAGNLLWGLMVSGAFGMTLRVSGFDWLSFALQCYVAYLLLQPDSAAWFD